MYKNSLESSVRKMLEENKKFLMELNPLDFGRPEEPIDQSGFILQFDKDGNPIRMTPRGGARDRISIPHDATDANTESKGTVAPRGTGMSDEPGEPVSSLTGKNGVNQSTVGWLERDIRERDKKQQDEQEAEEALKKLSPKSSSISSQMVVSSIDPGTKIQTKPVTFSRSKMIESVVSDLIRRTAK